MELKYVRYIGLVIAIVLVFTPLSFAIDKSDQLRHGYSGVIIERGLFEKTLKGFICFEVLSGVTTPYNLITCNQIDEIVTNELEKREIVVGNCNRINPFPHSKPNEWYAFYSSYFAYITVDLEVITLNETGDYIYVIKFDVTATSTLTRFPSLAFSGKIWNILPNGFFVDTGTVVEIKEKLKEITNNFADDYKAKVEWPEDNVWDMK